MPHPPHSQALQGCSGHGACEDERCVCDAGWSGTVCERPSAAPCRSGVTDYDGDCCASGVLDAEGSCCAGAAGTGVAETDADGQCCAEGVDACGVCGGRGTTLDAEGECCEARPPWL